MSNKLNEKYKKALDKYNRGELDKALKLCEECMAESLKMSAILNLKGIILYQRGRLSDAVAVWKINREVNDDELSKTYIKDAKLDENKVEVYKKAEEKINALMISEALDMLLECSESDFNCIKVNTALALCYLRKGEYPLCKNHIDKALNVDRNYKTAKEVKRELEIVYDNLKETKSNKKLYGAIFLTVVALGAAVSSLVETKTSAKVPIVKEEPKISNEKFEEEKKSEKSKLNTEELKEAIQNKEIYEIDNLIKEIKKEDLNKEEKNLYDKGIEVLKKEGVVEFYNKGQTSYQKEKFKSAEEDLKRSVRYGKDIYIYEHSLYYLGLTQIELGFDGEAIKTLKEYEGEFNKGTYSEEVLYRLALLNEKAKNLEEAKKYARRLKNNFPKSIYNNENMDKIIAK